MLFICSFNPLWSICLFLTLTLVTISPLSIILLSCLTLLLRARWPIECLPVDSDLVFFRPYKLLQVDFLSQSLLIVLEAALPGHKIFDRVRIYLPLLHLLVAGDRLRVLGVEVVIGHEDRIDVRSDWLKSELRDHYQAKLESFQSRIVRRDRLVVIPEKGRLHSDIRCETTTSESTQALSIGDRAFGVDADRTPV